MCLSLSAIAQYNPGDTIIVNTFHYGMTYGNAWDGTIRDTTVQFPSDTSLTFEKIEMLYNMRCRDGNVNLTGGNSNGCGEWDYSCNTYVTDSSKVDSTYNLTNSHIISGFSGSTYNYVTTPLYNYTRHLQTNVVLNSIISETKSTAGAGTTPLTDVIRLDRNNAKTQYIISQTDLAAAGVTAGNIDGLELNVTGGTGTAHFLRVRIKHTIKTSLDPSSPDLNGFTEVFFHDQAFVAGPNRIQFHSPFNWNGTSNIIVELSIASNPAAGALTIDGSNVGAGIALHTSDDQFLEFTGSNYVESNQFKGIAGNDRRTVEGWIKTTVGDKEIASWGRNSAGRKWVFRLNNAGKLRVEVNGGSIEGNLDLRDDNWHHVACTYGGTDVQHVRLYVDGVLDTISASSSEPVNTDTTAGINFRVSRGVNNRYFDGMIDEIRVWSDTLTGSTLASWMHRKYDPTHPNAASLELRHPFSGPAGVNVVDSTSNGRHGTIMNGEIRRVTTGDHLFKQFTSSPFRPNITFLQGSYNLTITTDTVLDSALVTPNYVQFIQIYPNNGTWRDDSIGVSSTAYYWESGYVYTFDTAGNAVDSTLINPSATINITQLPYYRRYPSKFEIMSFVTPYGINLNLGPNGKTWTFDMTDFTPVLKGWKRITVERGGQWQEDMDIKFRFIVGTPPRDVIDIQQIWKVDSRGYTQILADQAFEARDVVINPNASEYKIRTAITGHGQQGEFIPQTHWVDLDGGTNEFMWQVWKECADNPVFPQGGTWIYDRAGWCPGMATDVAENDITSYTSPGDTLNIDYGLINATGSSNYIVNNQLVSYGSPNHNLDVAVHRVIAPSDDVEFGKLNPICQDARVVIQNRGSTALTSARIEYWITGAATKEVYNWSGNLAFLDTAVITLPTSFTGFWTALSGSQEFQVEVSAPNGGADEYAFNNKRRTNVLIPGVVPQHMYVLTRNNNGGPECSWKLYNDTGGVVFQRQSMTNGGLYWDTLNLEFGCYKLEVKDTDGDGLSFFANNDGSGSIRINSVGSGPVVSFNPNFGNGFVYNFTVDYTLKAEDIQQDLVANVYPNPTTGDVKLELNGWDDQVDLQVRNELGQVIWSEQVRTTHSFAFVTVPMLDLKAGVYFVTVKDGKRSAVRKVIRTR